MTVIKWTGSKRSQAQSISKYINKDYNTYYEPFCGGCSILSYLLRENRNIKHYVASDINSDLINTYIEIKNNHKNVAKEYRRLWSELNIDDNSERKKIYYNTVRSEFNKTRNPNLFFFLMRVCANGMPRYNKSGDFNTSFHVTRNGMIPDKVDKLLENWNILTKRVEFKNCSYDKIMPSKNDVVYCDPPYTGTKGMYYGTINYQKLWNWLNNISCHYILSFNGVSDKIPLNARHITLKSGNSSFRRIIGKSNNTIVYESLYFKNEE